MFDKKTFDRNFTFEFRVSAANNVRIATEAFNNFWNNNSVFLDNADELYGRILAYAVNRQFIKSAVDTASAYLVSSQEVNTYKSKAVSLHTADYHISVCRTRKPNLLPCKAKYKLNLAAGNREYDTQLELIATPGDNQLFVSAPKKYAILGYNYTKNGLSHLNILVPDWHFENIIYSISLSDQIKEYYQYIPEPLAEEQVTELIDELKKIAQNQK